VFATASVPAPACKPEMLQTVPKMDGRIPPISRLHCRYHISASQDSGCRILSSPTSNFLFQATSDPESSCKSPISSIVHTALGQAEPDLDGRYNGVQCHTKCIDFSTATTDLMRMLRYRLRCCRSEDLAPLATRPAGSTRRYETWRNSKQISKSITGLILLSFDEHNCTMITTQSSR
jgi:hypothetical protein